MHRCGFGRAHASEDLGFPRRGPGEGLHSAQERGNFAAVFDCIGGVTAVPDGVPIAPRCAGRLAALPPCVRQRPFGLAGDWGVRSTDMSPSCRSIVAWSRCRGAQRDIEMVRGLFHPEFFIERYRRSVL